MVHVIAAYYAIAVQCGYSIIITLWPIVAHSWGKSNTANWGQKIKFQNNAYGPNKHFHFIGLCLGGECLKTENQQQQVGAFFLLTSVAQSSHPRVA